MPLLPKVGRTQPGMRFSRGGLLAFLFLGIALHLFPFYYLLVSSVGNPTDLQRFPPKFWPTSWDFHAWSLVFKLATTTTAQGSFLQEPFCRYFLNSLFIAFVTLALSLPITAFAAYAISKLQRGRLGRFLFLFFIGTMMVPFAVVLTPSFLMTRNFPFALPQAPSFGDYQMLSVRIWDTPWAVILPGVFVPFGFLMFKGFFDTIPDSVIQAARVDGGSEFNIFRRIVLPMSIPVFAVVAYTSFGSVWDNFLWQILVLQTPSRQTTSVAIYGLLNAFTASGADNAAQAGAQSQHMSDMFASGLSWPALMVLGLLQTIPIFIAFVVCREYLLRGIRLRGLK